MITITKDLIGRRVLAYGQVTTVTSVQKAFTANVAVANIEPPIVTPKFEVKRDFLRASEITEVEYADCEGQQALPQDTYDRGESQEY